MRFLVDAQLPPALARWLAGRRDLLAWFPTVLPDILSALVRGQTLIEVT